MPPIQRCAYWPIKIVIGKPISVDLYIKYHFWSTFIIYLHWNNQVTSFSATSHPPGGNFHFLLLYYLFLLFGDTSSPLTILMPLLSLALSLVLVLNSCTFGITPTTVYLYLLCDAKAPPPRTPSHTHNLSLVRMTVSLNKKVSVIVKYLFVTVLRWNFTMILCRSKLSLFKVLKNISYYCLFLWVQSRQTIIYNYIYIYRPEPKVSVTQKWSQKKWQLTFLYTIQNIHKITS